MDNTIRTENPEISDEDFYDFHTSFEVGIIWVEVRDAKGLLKAQAPFKSFKKAEEWYSRFEDTDSVLLAPYMLDEPSFGNTPKKELN